MPPSRRVLKRLLQHDRSAIFNSRIYSPPFLSPGNRQKTYNLGGCLVHPTALVTFQTGNRLSVRSFIMKFTALVLFCSLALAMAQTANSQSRPRRVGANPPH